MAKVISLDGETELFEILAGVSQGDTLAPYLFVIVFDFVLRMVLEGKEEVLGFQSTRRQSQRTGPETVTDFDFTDDIALLSEGLQQAEQLFQRVEMSVTKNRLKMNASKTKSCPKCQLETAYDKL